MKYFAAMILLIVWMVMTLLLAISIFGITVLIDEDSRWMSIPGRLLNILDPHA